MPIERSVPQLSPVFVLLQQEGHLISSSLAAGLTKLRASNVHDKGSCYSSLFNLSIGIERLMKVVVIIDHMLVHDLSVPTRRELKARGHNIAELYDECKQVGDRYGRTVPSRDQLDPIDSLLLNLVSDFALGARYHNLDSLSSSQNNQDPLNRLNAILIKIFEQDVPVRRRDVIHMNARISSELLGDIAITIMHGLDQQSLTTSQALELPGIHIEAARHAVLRVIRLIIPIKGVVEKLDLRAYGSGSTPAYPQMHEFIDWLWDDRAFVMRKKRWP
jgi:hypothetical protein